jgi:hypothetical protein
MTKNLERQLTRNIGQRKCRLTRDSAIGCFFKKLPFAAYFVNRFSRWPILALTAFLLTATCHAVSLGSLTFNGVFPRIFTPNGDGFNDKALFHFDNPELLPVSGTVYDIAGARVGNLSPTSSDPTGLLAWDGKDSDGKTVPGGIYLYKIEYQGQFLTGTVVVAR